MLITVQQRVEFKVATLVHQALSGHLPGYLANDYCLVTDDRPRRLLSADTRMLLISQMTTSFGDTAFRAAEPLVCQLSANGYQTAGLVMSYSRFRQSLKTYLFGQRGQSAV